MSDNCVGGFKFLNSDPIAFELLDSLISSSSLLRFCGSSSCAYKTSIRMATILLLPLDPKRYNSTELDDGNHVWCNFLLQCSNLR